MYDDILFPTDGSTGADAVLDHVLDIAATHDATLHVLYVADTTHDSVTRIGQEVVDTLEREGERIVADVAERAADRRVSTVTDVRQGGVSATIAAYADTYGIDLIVMPTQGRTGVERVLLGSVTETVIRRAPVPVLTLRPDDTTLQYPYRTVLVPTDGSDCATAALTHATETIDPEATTLHVLSVVDLASLGFDTHSVERLEPLEAHAEEVVAAAGEVAETAGVDSVVTATEAGAVIHRTIQSYIDEHDVDLVVMGTHGRTGVERYLLGSVTEKTVRTASVPVLVVPTPEDEATTE